MLLKELRIWGETRISSFCVWCKSRELEGRESSRFLEGAGMGGWQVYEMCGVGGRQVYGICSHRLVCSELVVARSNYKKSYLRIFRNPPCGDSTESSRVEKDRVGVPPGLVWGKGGEEGCD